MNLYIAIYFDNHKLEIFLTDNIIQHSSYRSVLVKSIFHGSQEVYYGATVSIVYISYLVMMIPSITLPNVQAKSSPVFSVTTCLPRYLVRRCLCYNYHSGSSHRLAPPWQSTASCLSLPGNWGLFIFVILPHNLQPEAGIILMIYHMEAGHHISNLLPDISISFNTKFGILMKDFLIEKPPARTSLWGNIAVLA